MGGVFVHDRGHFGGKPPCLVRKHSPWHLYTKLMGCASVGVRASYGGCQLTASSVLRKLLHP